MISLWFILTVVHLIGLALGVGAASIKILLLVKCYKDHAYLPTWFKVVKPITRLLITGLILMTLSGIGWLLLGAGFTTLLIVKLVLVGMIWIVGPIIDNVLEPRFHRLAPAMGEMASNSFLQVQKQHLAIEVMAALLFYVILVIGILL